MNPSVETKSTATTEDPYRFGWRYVRREGPDGTVNYEQIPLTAEDVLHPQEDDFIVQNDAHLQDCRTICNALELQTAEKTNWLVLMDHGVDWGVEGIEPFGPDLAVFDRGTVPEVGATFSVAETGANTVLVVEITSPTTRDNDLGIKVSDYERCGVPLYVIVDRGPDWTGCEVQLLAYQATSKGYTRLRPDRQGRLWLEPVRLWLAIEENRAVCYDEDGTRIDDFTTTQKDRCAQKTRADNEKTRADNEKTRADAAEKRIRELEDALRRSQGKTD